MCSTFQLHAKVMTNSRERAMSFTLPVCFLVLTLAILVSGSSRIAADVPDPLQDQEEQKNGRTTVDMELGPVVGRVLPDGVREFLGIPYALPPVDELRFQPPVPLASWGGGKLEALEFGAECMQSVATNPAPSSGISEDCLFLNVWTPPGCTRNSKLPVMVWLYGGGFQQGASSHPEYNGRHLADTGVVVVSINYRVGALGWMVSVNDNLWGNYGLQDQRLGMEWVHHNVVRFGGDPGRVTLFGESAGAMSIGQHLHMDGAGLLFHQVVMQSNPMGYRFRSVTVANFMGEAVKRGLDCVDLDCLQTESAADIMRVQESIMGLPRSVGDFFTWGPVMTDRNYRRHVGKHQKTWVYDEKEAQAEAEKEENVFELIGGGGTRQPKPGKAREGPKHDYAAPFMNVVQPLEVMARGATAAAAASAKPNQGRGGGQKEGDEDRVTPVPVMLGVNADEGRMFVHGAFPLTMPKLVYYSFVTALFRTSMVGVLRAYGYLADQCEESGDYRKVMSQIMHDYLFRCPNLRAAQLLQEQNGQAAPVYVYEFSHPTEVPGFPECSGTSCHTAELPYVFNNIEIIKESYSYHEESGPAAPPAPEDGLPDAEGGDGGDDGKNGGALAVVGSALGGVAGAVRSGFGVGRLFGRKMSTPGEEVADAIGTGGVGFVANMAAKAAAEVGEAQSEPDTKARVNAASTSATQGNSQKGEGKRTTVTTDARASPVEGEEACREGVRESPDLEESRARAAETNGSLSQQQFEETSSGKDEADTPNSGRSFTEARSSSGEESALGERLEGVDAQEGEISGRDANAASRGETTGLGGSRCAAMAGEVSSSSDDGADGQGEEMSLQPPRPTKTEAAEADILVGEAMVNYWSSFGKSGSPNGDQTSVMWPAWEGSRLAAQGEIAGAVPVAAMLASGRGGVGKGSFSDVFAEAWSEAAAAGGAGISPWGGGPFFLDIKAYPEVQEAKQDCMCQFWDRLKYRH